MTLIGADISARQPNFDFETNRQVSPFVILKQTEGLTWPNQDDPFTADLLRSMRRAAIQARYTWIGLYHYARPQPGRTGRQEADHFIWFVDRLEPNEGVVLDFEENRGLDRESLETFALDFVDRIEERFPSMRGKVLFYSYPAFMAGMSTGRLVQRCPLYVAAYGSNDGKPHPSAVSLDRWDRYTFWQYTSKGVIAGAAGEVDLNCYDGDEASLAALGADRPSQPPMSAPADDEPTPAPAFAPEGWPGEYLRRGSSGIRVVQIQQRLKRRGWTIDIDGEFGRATDTVVRKFQEEKGLVVDGIVGETTWDAMYAFFDGVDVLPEPYQPPPTPVPPPPEPGPTGGEHPDPEGMCATWGFDGNAGLNPVAEFQRAYNLGPALKVDGDAGRMTAQAVQKVVDAGGLLSPHFSIAELACKHCGRIRFLRETLETMERIREQTGPFTPVSAYRCPTHNRNIGGAINSQHMMGAACDLNIPLPLAKEAGASGIGTCGDRCLHVDRRDASGNNTTGATQSDPTFWGYC